MSSGSASNATEAINCNDGNAGNTSGYESSSQGTDGQEAPAQRTNRKALLIGVHYYGNRKMQLDAPFADAINVGSYLSGRGFDEVRLLTDNPKALAKDPGLKQPTRANILDELTWLTDGCQQGDSLFFAYSGHGGQVPDENDDEEDGLDEAIYPSDYEEAGDEIIDDVLASKLVDPLPAGVKLHAIFDCCHSGSMLDLPDTYITNAGSNMDLPQVRRCAKHLACQAKLSLKLEGGVIKSVRRGIATLKGLRQLGRDISCEVEESSGWNRNYRPQQSGGSGTVYCFSSCRDDQTCVEYEGESVHGAMLTGAFTRAFLDSWDQHPVQSYTDVLRHTRQQLLGGFDQVTQLSASINADINVAMEV